MRPLSSLTAGVSAVAIALAIYAATLFAQAAVGNPPVREVLDAHAKAQEVLQETRIVSVVETQRADMPGEPFPTIVCDYRSDGEERMVRLFMLDEAGPDPREVVERPFEQWEGLAGLREVREYLSRDGKLWSYQWQMPEHGFLIGVFLRSLGDPRSDDARLRFGDMTSAMRGYLGGDDLWLAERLRAEIDAVRLVEGAEAVLDGRQMVLLELESEQGDFRVWFDPGRDFNIVRAEVDRGPDHILYGRTVAEEFGWTPGPDSNRPSSRYEYFDVQLEQFRAADGRLVWLPVVGVMRNARADGSGEVLMMTSGMRRVLVDLDPRFDAPFKLSAPDGTPVHLMDEQDGVPREWRDGEIVVVVDQEAASGVAGDVERRRAERGYRSPETLPPAAARGVGVGEWLLLAGLVALLVGVGVAVIVLARRRSA